MSTVVAPELTDQERFELLKSWSAAQGTIGYENIDFPEGFCDTFSPVDAKYPVTGVVAKQDLEHRMAILAIPF